MIRNLFVLLTIFSLQSFSGADTTEFANDMIEKVETGLVAPVYIEGDAKWSIQERMEHYGVPGVSIAVINRGKIEWTKAYGVMDKESQSPVTSETLFQSASISKPVSAYGALCLAEQNELGLNEDINMYLKSWKLPDSEFTEEKKVTIKNLLNHSAGTTVHGFWGYSPGLEVPTLIEVLNGIPPANSAPTIVDKTPEKSFRYSGGGYNVIQQMMIDVAGKPFPELMKELVLDPLEMNNSSYNQPLPDGQLVRAATGYLPDGSMTKGKRHTYPEMAPAGLWTTAEDLAKFAINIFETIGERPENDLKKDLSKEMTIKMLTPFVEEFSGLGIFLKRKKDEVYFGHAGWNEGFSSEMITHKEEGYGVVVLTNSNHPGFVEEVIRSVAISYEWKDFCSVYKKMEVDPSFTDEVVGRYHVADNKLVEVFRSGKQLMGKELGQEPIELVKVSDSSYVKRSNDNLIQFKMNEESKMMDMVTLNSSDGTMVSTCSRLKDVEKIPIAHLVEGNFDQALEAYQALRKIDLEEPSINEGNLNNLGYQFLGRGQTKIAQDIFKVNMILYPESSNVYDSYAEASMIIGEVDLALKNYKRSISLNPQNEHAKEMVKELLKKK